MREKAAEEVRSLIMHGYSVIGAVRNPGDESFKLYHKVNHNRATVRLQPDCVQLFVNGELKSTVK